MKRTLILAAVMATAMVGWQIANSEEPTSQPASQPATQPSNKQALSTASYGLGYELGRNMKRDEVELDQEQLLEGLRDATAGKPSKLSQEQLMDAMMTLQQEILGRREAAAQKAGEAAKAAGDKYLTDNKAKEGVVTTESGLQIETLKEGTGETPSANSTVRVHYTGTLVDGTVFDSSVQRGQPAEFPVNGVIPGWTEALQKMKVGGKARLVIPPHLAYGPAGSPPTIPPQATLIFEVELLDIVK